ncbi:MAG: hypothetical protein ABIG89_07425 [Candidatus Woesearchaeota archaeon]
MSEKKLVIDIGRHAHSMVVSTITYDDKIKKVKLDALSGIGIAQAFQYGKDHADKLDCQSHGYLGDQFDERSIETSELVRAVQTGACIAQTWDVPVLIRRELTRHDDRLDRSQLAKYDSETEASNNHMYHRKLYYLARHPEALDNVSNAGFGIANRLVANINAMDDEFASVSRLIRLVGHGPNTGIFTLLLDDTRLTEALLHYGPFIGKAEGGNDPDVNRPSLLYHSLLGVYGGCAPDRVEVIKSSSGLFKVTYAFRFRDPIKTNLQQGCEEVVKVDISFDKLRELASRYDPKKLVPETPRSVEQYVQSV